MSPKDRARKALENHHAKLAGKTRRFTRNKKPEKLVASACLHWMHERGWDVQIIEAKATYNVHAGRYLRNNSVSTGTCDCIGTLPNGVFVAVEFKSPTRLTTFNSDRNMAQRDYIIAKIHSGAFGAVVDSVARLELIYNTWCEALKVGTEKSKLYLLNMLPKRENRE